MSRFSQGQWKPPVGEWSVHVGTERLAPSRLVPRDSPLPLNVLVWTLCGKEDVRIVAVPKEDCTVSQFARQCQIVASAHHPSQRACRECLEAFAFRLTPHERTFLYTADPKLGPIVGVEIAKAAARKEPR